MNIYVFNIMLWKALFNLLKVNSKTVRMSADERVIRNIRKDGAVRMDALVELCNNYNLDIRQFFIKAGEIIPLELCTVSKQNRQILILRNELIPSIKGRCIARHTDVLDALNTYGRSLEEIFSLTSISQQEPEVPEVKEELQEENNEPVFNSDLFSLLPQILSTTRVQIGRKSGHAVTLWQRTVESQNISVLSLVDVCNAFHLDINAFWQTNHSENIVFPESEWTPIEFHPERLRSLYVGKGAPENMTSICAKTGFTRIRLERYVKNPTAMQADDIVHLCKCLNLSPAFFYDAPHMIANGKLANDMRRKLEIAREAEDRKNAEIQLLQSRIQHLEAMLEMKK